MTSKFDPEAVAIGRAARGAIATAGLSIAEAAAAAGMAERTLSRRVNGELPLTFLELVSLAKVCGVLASDLVIAAERITNREQVPA